MTPPISLLTNIRAIFHIPKTSSFFTRPYWMKIWIRPISSRTKTIYCRQYDSPHRGKYTSGMCTKSITRKIYPAHWILAGIKLPAGSWESFEKRSRIQRTEWRPINYLLYLFQIRTFGTLANLYDILHKKIWAVSP